MTRMQRRRSWRTHDPCGGIQSQVWRALTRRSWNDKLAARCRWLGHGETLKAHECFQSGLHRRWQSGHAAMLHYGSGFWLFSWPWAMPTKTIERRQAGRNSIQTSRCGINREVCIFEVPLLYQSQEGVGWHGRPIQSSRFGPDGPGGTLVTSKPASYSYWWYLMAETRTWGCGKSIWVHSSIAIQGWKIHHFGGISMYFLGKMGKSDCCVSLPVGMSRYVSQLWTCNVEGQGATCRAGQEDEAYLYAKHLHCRGRYWRTWWLLMFVDSVDGKWNKMMARHGPLLGLQKSRSANTRQYFLQDISSQVHPKTKFILLPK